jgi:hypothetical protein
MDLLLGFTEHLEVLEIRLHQSSHAASRYAPRPEPPVKGNRPVTLRFLMGLRWRKRVLS